jgi:4-oxalocrotonate tautomerase
MHSVFITSFSSTSLRSCVERNSELRRDGFPNAARLKRLNHRHGSALSSGFNPLESHAMPLVRINLPAATSDAQMALVGDAVHQALVETFDVPLPDRFQVITRNAPNELVCTPEFLGIAHSPTVVFVQIACSPGRSLEMKKALYVAIASKVAAHGHFAAPDVIINLVETARENWSFGNGIAQYAV